MGVINIYDEVFEEINSKILEIMNLIEKQDNSPLLSCDFANFVGEDKEREKLCNIYV